MKVFNLTNNSTIYTCNVYLVQGSWNRIQDVNTLIDVGRDPALVEILQGTTTGVGKPKVQQVVLTHSHYDHVEILPRICDVFHPVVYAFSKFLKNADHHIEDGDKLTIGDQTFEVMHTPGHSSDSVCLYCEQDGSLFAGDTQVQIRTDEGSYEDDFIDAFARLCQRDIKTIYLGHGAPITTGAQQILRKSLNHMRNARSAGTRERPVQEDFKRTGQVRFSDDKDSRSENTSEYT